MTQRILVITPDKPKAVVLLFAGDDGDISTGDPCEARAHHGFNGIEREVVQRIAAWISVP